MAYSIAEVLGTFSGFKGCQIPTDPTNQSELTALKPVPHESSVWEGTPPTWDEVVAKKAELDKTAPEVK